ncbi:hypothetical protein BB558_003379 [Smittium angustum]|uniref:Transmembrane protein n=1 Tax=Smittium angustum TaxID=133377 RepID=A0A2U1J689_SMIAN|nr:hypothetical protein BB558_003379 [Smittium angustum]
MGINKNIKSPSKLKHLKDNSFTDNTILDTTSTPPKHEYSHRYNKRKHDSSSSLEHPLKRKSTIFKSKNPYPGKLSIANLITVPNIINTLDYGTVNYISQLQNPTYKNDNSSLNFFSFDRKPSSDETPLLQDYKDIENDPWNIGFSSTSNNPISEAELFSDQLDLFNPHWEDMVTFRESRLKFNKKRKWSISHSLNINENSSSSFSEMVSFWVSGRINRFLCLTALPVLVVLAWVSIPIPSRKKEGGTSENDYQTNFWFFLFFYYGVYNICALLLVTQIFHLYSLNWWPDSMSATSAIILSWFLSMSFGAIFYKLDIGLVHSPLVWTGVTLVTLLFPLLLSFVQIRKNYSASTNRQVLNTEQTLFFHSLEWQIPSSYRRFLWFCVTFLLWYVALSAGEYLAYQYAMTLPHNNVEGLFYVYTWLITVNSLDFISSWLITTKIRSWPLQYSYQLYYSLTYFIFYRNLFARLRSPKQYVYIQLGSSLWVVLFIPLRMCKITWKILTRLGLSESYDEYVRQIGFTFYLRNLAENATMLGFLCWVAILHYGPNRFLYPYFKFLPSDDEPDFHYSIELTIKASAIIWAFELVVSRMVRILSNHLFKIDIAEINILNLKRYPYMVPVIILLTIHVLQNMLFALIKLDFY